MRILHVSIVDGSLIHNSGLHHIFVKPVGQPDTNESCHDKHRMSPEGQYFYPINLRAPSIFKSFPPKSLNDYYGSHSNPQ